MFTPVSCSIATEHAALAGVLRATAAQRDGDDATARRELTDALERADALGYVWLRLLCLESLAALEPEAGHDRTLERAVRRVAQDLGSSRTRTRLIARWLPTA